MAYSNFGTAPTLYKNLPRPARFPLISNHAATPLALLAHRAAPEPARLIAFAKKRPGQVNFASAGSGAASRLTTGC
jgi:hypothetical protein